MKAFDDCGCVDKISPAQHAHEVRIELSDLYSGRAMHFVGRWGRGEETCTGSKEGEFRKRRSLSGSVRETSSFQPIQRHVWQIYSQQQPGTTTKHKSVTLRELKLSLQMFELSLNANALWHGRTRLLKELWCALAPTFRSISTLNVQSI